MGWLKRYRCKKLIEYIDKAEESNVKMEHYIEETKGYIGRNNKYIEETKKRLNDCLKQLSQDDATQLMIETGYMEEINKE